MPLQKALHWFLNSLQNLFQKWVPLFFLTPHERTIGNTAEEIHYGLLYARRHGKKLILLRRFQFGKHPVICNKELFRVLSEHSLRGPLNRFVVFCGNSFLSIFFGYIPAAIRWFFLNSFNFLKYVLGTRPLPYRHFRFCFFHLSLGVEKLWSEQFSQFKTYNWQKELKEPISLFFDSSKEEQGKRTLLKLGLPPGAWFACLHNREGGFYKDQHDYRNNKIENYFLGIKAITDAGGWVIRMGDASMTKLPTMERVIDYPFTEFKSEFMDLYLLRECRFFVGQNSGIMDCAYLFQKKSILVNMTEWSIGFPRMRDSLAIFKHRYSHKDKEFFSIESLLEQPFSCQHLEWDGQGSFYQENTPEEIRDVIIEGLSRDFDSKNSPLQDEFVSKRREQITRWLSEDRFTKDRLLRLRIASRYSVEGTLGRKFLETYWEKSHAKSADIHAFSSH